MSRYEEEVEDRAESPGFSCVSLKSDTGDRPNFSKEPGPSHTEPKNEQNMSP